MGGDGDLATMTSNFDDVGQERDDIAITAAGVEYTAAEVQHLSYFNITTAAAGAAGAKPQETTLRAAASKRHESPAAVGTAASGHSGRACGSLPNE